MTNDLPEGQKTWGQVFEELAPYYLSIGMSADEYTGNYGYGCCGYANSCAA